MSIVTGKPFSMNLPCPLGDVELATKRDELVGELDTLDSIEIDKKEAVDEFKAQMQSIAERAIQLRRQIRTRSEDRPVECVKHADLEHFTLTVVRTDTADVIQEHTMSESERDPRAQRQMEMSEAKQ